MTRAATPVTGPAAGLSLAMTIIDNVDIPLGSTRSDTPSGGVRDYTQWVAAADTATGRYCLHTYAKNWRCVNVKEGLDKAGKTVLHIPLDAPAGYPDRTNTATPMPRTALPGPGN